MHKQWTKRASGQSKKSSPNSISNLVFRLDRFKMNYSKKEVVVPTKPDVQSPKMSESNIKSARLIETSN